MFQKLLFPVWLLLGFLVTVSVAAAQAPAGDVTHTRYQVFKIPFHTNDAQRLKEVQLYVSTDQGRSWNHYATVSPREEGFRFTANRDGLYWFAPRTLDWEGRAYPPSMDGATPMLKVVVDTLPPSVDFRVLPPRETLVGISWDIRDENLDLGSLRVEFHYAGSSEWRALAIDPAPAGQHYWRPDTSAALEARLRVRDRAENWAERTIAIGGNPEAVRRDVSNPNQLVPAISNINPYIVGSKRISLNYKINDKGPSGVSRVELWYTAYERRTWQKKEEPNPQEPYVISFDAPGEGLYGFTMVVVSGAGLSDRPPQVGDQPQVWVEVDMTKPVVSVQEPEVGMGLDKGKLTITWHAQDKNLGPKPITLCYAANKDGPWTDIVTNIENTGRYVWSIPSDVAERQYKFFIRVKATDKAANTGSAETERPVNTDLSKPKATISGVEPGSGL